MIYAYLTTCLILIVALFCLYRFTDLKNRPYVFQAILIFLLALSTIARIYQYNTTMGIDADEAMGGVNSWSLAHYGLDYFNNTSHPVYLYAWGSGMNILYPLLAAPFVKIFGLSIVVYRLPMILIGIISIYFLAFTMLKSQWSNWALIIYTAAFGLSTGLITTSRWAVESNLFPALMVTTVSLTILFTHFKRQWLFLMINLVLALSAYAYSNNWFFLAFLVLGWLVYSGFHQLASIRTIIVTLIGYLVIDWPLALFMYVNYICHHQINVLGLTITKMATSRGGSQFVFSNGGGVKAIFNNLPKTLDVLLAGNGGFLKSGLPNYGILPPLMLLAGLTGLILICWHLFDPLHALMVIMLMANLPTVLMIVPNNTHLNALTVPVLYLASYAFTSIPTHWLKSGALTLIILIFTSFSYRYLVTYHQDLTANTETPTELIVLLKSANKTKHPIYVTTNYTFTLFSNPISPSEFHKTAAKVSPAEFINYPYYAQYHLISDIPQRLPKNAILIIRKGTNLSNAYQQGFHVQKSNTYYQELTR